jgi:protein-L-isoaspartate(D-aspartate) O-methyltransferase
VSSDMKATSRERLLAALRSSGISDERILSAFSEVPREEFVPDDLRPDAYENVALPIGEGQTISQPIVVAAMVQAVHPGPHERVLEIGTGSGYGAAILSRLARDVVTVEIRANLAEGASRRLRDLGYTNICVVVGDGSLGWAELAPYDAIVVTAASPSLPPELIRQLGDGGRLVAPVGSLSEQELVLVERIDGRVRSRPIGGVQFVPLRGAAGFAMARSPSSTVNPV